MKQANPYERLLSSEEVAANHHRGMVGGMWDQMGRHQLDYLVAKGLRADMRFVDIGCGALRGGVHFVRFLDAGNYFGLDINASLIEAGYEVETRRAGVQHKLPRDHLMVDDRFALGRFGVRFDMALAQSVFTHLPLNDIRRCMVELASVLAPGGKFFATYFEYPEGTTGIEPCTHEPGGVTTHLDQNPYHYRPEEIEWCARGLPLVMRSAGEWGHPRDQRMIVFESVSTG